MNHSISSTVTGKTKVKIVFLGGQAVGKSSLIEKYIHDRFDQTANPTVGIDFLAKNLTHRGKNYRLQLWDTAGQQRFRSLIPSYLKDAHCALVVFDVTSKASFAETEMWVNLFNDNKSGEGFVLLLGNKIDLDYREISAQEAKQKVEKLGVRYLQVSAKTGQHVEELFHEVIDIFSEKQGNPPSLIDKKPAIVQSSIRQEQQCKQNPDETDTKLTADPARNQEGVSVSAPGVVLKNEKLGAKERQKGCC